jgi:hypothetical protein
MNNITNQEKITQHTKEIKNGLNYVDLVHVFKESFGFDQMPRSFGIFFNISCTYLLGEHFETIPKV